MVGKFISEANMPKNDVEQGLHKTDGFQNEDETDFDQTST
jgi:hypothetical protein